MNAIVRRAILAGVVAAVVVGTVAHVAADICVYKPPKVRRICGVIVDPSGVPIPGATVAILKDGTAVKTAPTDDTGEFDFDVIQPGKYELDATVPGFQHARYQLTFSKPIKSCKHALRVQMTVGGIHCDGDIRETNNPLSGKQ